MMLWLATLLLIFQGVHPFLITHDESFAPDYVLNVSLQNAAIGCKYRYSFVVNGTTPGPEVRLKENQTSWIRVYNSIPDQNLTMHWHGLSQSVAPFSDGSPRASQWPIPPLHYFDYEVHTQLGEAGSYFYHSHVGFQAASVAGPLIVEETLAPIPFQYDEERTMFLSELFNKTEENLVSGLTASSNTSFHWTGETETVLLNGQAANSSNAEESVACGTEPGFGPPCDDPIFSENSGISPCSPEIIKVDPGKTYRFRTIGGLATALVLFAFEDHNNLTIIAADGQYTKPLSVDRIQAGPGQRFDFLLETKSSEELQQLNKTNFLIRMDTRQRIVNVTNYAILQYNSPSGHDQVLDPSAFAQPSTAPLSLPDDVWNWPAESQLTPLDPTKDVVPALGDVTRRIYLSNHQLSSQNAPLRWSINEQTWSEDTPDTTPYLISIYQNGESAIPSLDRANAYGGWDPQFNAYPAEVGEVLEIVIINENDALSGGLDSHSWHIHGQHVFDIGAGPGTYDPNANEQRLQSSGIPPAKRDSMFVWKYTDGDDLQYPDGTQVGWRAWRFRIENAGVWMVHCHLLQHMVMGMQSVWVVGNASDIVGKGLEESTGYLSYGGDVYGNDTFSAMVNHYWGDGQCCQD